MINVFTVVCLIFRIYLSPPFVFSEFQKFKQLNVPFQNWYDSGKEPLFATRTEHFGVKDDFLPKLLWTEKFAIATSKCRSSTDAGRSGSRSVQTSEGSEHRAPDAHPLALFFGVQWNLLSFFVLWRNAWLLPFYVNHREFSLAISVMWSTRLWSI